MKCFSYYRYHNFTINVINQFIAFIRVILVTFTCIVFNLNENHAMNGDMWQFSVTLGIELKFCRGGKFNGMPKRMQERI